ncbi:MAG: hypothetical protein IVW57_17830 [Ktedonobacterales bacterium]|nr:hypothetical protein [Ktedonobacterales bacterium]
MATTTSTKTTAKRGGKGIAATRQTAEERGPEVAALLAECERLRANIHALDPRLDANPGSFDLGNLQALIEAKTAVALLGVLGVSQEQITLVRALAMREVLTQVLTAVEAQTQETRRPRLLVPTRH